MLPHLPTRVPGTTRGGQRRPYYSMAGRSDADEENGDERWLRPRPAREGAGYNAHSDNLDHWLEVNHGTCI